MDRFGQKVLAPLVLRLGLAVIFIYHGLSKLGPDTRWGTAWAGDLDLPPAVQAAVAWGEFLGGVALAIGFLARLAALGLIVIMVGAIALVHGQHGFALYNPISPSDLGYEYNFALIVLCLGVVLLGSGPVGLDYLLRPAEDQRSEVGSQRSAVRKQGRLQ